MLLISEAQLDKLQAGSEEKFIAKLDGFLSRHLDKKYVAVAHAERLDYLRRAIESARVLGVESEYHLYAYSVLSIIYGEAGLTDRLEQQCCVERDGDHVQAVDCLYDDLMQRARSGK